MTFTLGCRDMCSDKSSLILSGGHQLSQKCKKRRKKMEKIAHGHIHSVHKATKKLLALNMLLPLSVMFT